MSTIKFRTLVCPYPGVSDVSVPLGVRTLGCPYPWVSIPWCVLTQAYPGVSCVRTLVCPYPGVSVPLGARRVRTLGLLAYLLAYLLACLLACSCLLACMLACLLLLACLPACLLACGMPACILQPVSIQSHRERTKSDVAAASLILRNCNLLQRECVEKSRNKILKRFSYQVMYVLGENEFVKGTSNPTHQYPPSMFGAGQTVNVIGT